MITRQTFKNLDAELPSLSSFFLPNIPCAEVNGYLVIQANARKFPEKLLMLARKYPGITIQHCNGKLLFGGSLVGPGIPERTEKRDGTFTFHISTYPELATPRFWATLSMLAQAQRKTWVTEFTSYLKPVQNNY
ncbi:hypothetical protein PQC07_gp098 [Aeromonas phage D3]|uniref:Uncharacterized protein n=1 Tax=Aeromonas phage D3 TaxID=2593327 RepID=A0A514TV51_9CAUD|nr:hypothetical protein PQC07_gp098 [Aeromonas phage D3]QDJ96907.1 hypothetical protein D3_0177 [Aeromonas phage D3]QEP52214.1 hypothetical protein D9_0007 [Aeromonas phage D9]